MLVSTSGFIMLYIENSLTFVLYCVFKLVHFVFFRNIIHGSDSVPSAEKEISLWFKEEELCNYTLALDSWVYEDN